MMYPLSERRLSVSSAFASASAKSMKRRENNIFKKSPNKHLSSAGLWRRHSRGGIPRERPNKCFGNRKMGRVLPSPPARSRPPAFAPIGHCSQHLPLIAYFWINSIVRFRFQKNCQIQNFSTKRKTNNFVRKTERTTFKELKNSI